MHLTAFTDTPVLREPQADANLARDGYAVVDLLDRPALDHLDDRFRHFAPWHHGPFAVSLLIPDAGARRQVHQAVHQAMALALADVLDRYRCVFCGFAAKAPCSEGGDLSLHQDISFSAPQGRPALSIWAPLVQVDARNGGLRLVPGSHRINSGARAPGSRSAAREIHAYEQAGLVRDLPLRPGQAVVMDQRLLHASGGNRSHAVRPAATAVAVPAEEPVRYYHRSVLDGQALLEGFDVADDFYLSHALGQRPGHGISLGIWPEQVDTIHPQSLTPHPGQRP